MRRPLAGLAVNAALVAVAALTLFPLAWMVSASFMAPGAGLSSATSPCRRWGPSC